MKTMTLIGQTLIGKRYELKKLKVATIIGTRPEIIRLSEVIKKCDKVFQHTIIHTGQNWDYSLNEVFFKELSLRSPDHFLGVVGDSLGKTIGNIIAKSYDLLNELRPDAVLILGDTNSALSAISAKRLKIPIFHMEAGNRCFDQNVPEEINRKIVDHISDINLPYTEHSRKYLLSEGFRKEHIFVTGSPLAEVIQHNLKGINSSNILRDLNLAEKKYILLSAHREENIDIEENLISLFNGINSIAECYGLPIIYSTHPRSKKALEIKKIKLHPLIQSLKPFGFYDYNNLQKNAFAVISDSGTLSEESSILSFPGILIRTSTERPETLDSGNIVLGGISKDSIIQAIEVSTTSLKTKNIPADYRDLNVSQKVVNLIQSYTNIIKRNIYGINSTD